MAGGAALIRLRAYLRGILSYVPAVDRLFAVATKGSDSPRYCYAVWLRHLVCASREGLNGSPPVVAELGPGDSVGVGLAALLCGTERYEALDAVDYTRLDRNLDTLESLVELFTRREPIPGDDEFPAVEPRLSDYAFPSDLLESRLDEALRRDRVRAIRSALIRPGRVCDGIAISYRAPWDDARVVRTAGVDAVVSQAVFEHVDDPAGSHCAVHDWLRPGGWASHTIDCSAHYLSSRWNAHWTVGRAAWKVIRGRRPWLLNREPASRHLAWMRQAGLEPLRVERVYADSEIDKRQLAGEFRTLSDEDLRTRGLYVLARRPPLI